MKVLLAVINKLNKETVGESYNDKLTDLTDFWIFNAVYGKRDHIEYQINTHYFPSEQAALDFSAEHNYDFLIGNLIGHLLRPGYVNGINVLEETINTCITSDGLIGHIMAHPEKIPYLYDEFWCMDVEVYKELGAPKWKMDEKTVFPQFSRSEQNFHSNYTPYYITNGEGNCECTMQCNEGVGLIKAWLENGKDIKNISKKIRDLKHHLYPEDHILLSQYLESKIPVTELQQELQLQFFSQVDYNHAKNCIFLFNTDRMDFTPPKVKIDNLVAVCAAFRPYLILHRSGFDYSTKVKFIDYSQVSLDFKKWLVENWDGVDINYAIVEFEKYYKTPVTWNYPFHKTFEESYIEVQNEFGGKESWLEFWDNYKKLQHEYHLIDLVENTDYIEKLLTSEQNYVYYSNLFNTEAGLIKWGRKKLESNLKILLEHTSKHNVVLDGSDVSHHYPEPDIQTNVTKYYEFRQQ